MVQGKQNRAQFTNWLCYEASGVCKSKPPPLPKGRKPGPAFQVIDPKEAEMEKMLAGMKVLSSTQHFPSTPQKRAQCRPCTEACAQLYWNPCTIIKTVLSNPAQIYSMFTASCAQQLT